MTKARDTAQLVSSKTGIAVTISGDPVVIGIANTEYLRINASGRMGLGYDSPNALLHIGGTAAAQGNSTNPALQLGGATTYRLGMYTLNEAAVIENANGDDGIHFYTKNASPAYGEAVRIDGTGNIGIGQSVTSAYSGHTNIFLGGIANVYSEYSESATNSLSISLNAYIKAGASWTHKLTGKCANYYQYDGTHGWRYSASALVGSGVTWVQGASLDANGKFSIASADYSDTGAKPELYVKGTSGRTVKFHNPNNTTCSLQFSNGQTGEGEDAGTMLYCQGTTGDFKIVNSYSSADFTVYTGGSDRFYILSNGNIGIGVADPGNVLEVKGSTVPLRCYRTTSATTVGGITFFSDVGGTESQRFEVASDGDVFNINNSYGTLSDIKLKQDIADAGSQWDDIKQLRFVNYKLKSEVSHEVGIGSTLGYTAPRLLGLIAQEVELVSPGLISNRDDVGIHTVAVLDENGEQARNEDGSLRFHREEVSLGTTTKAIKTSVLQMKVAKALQEAIVKIETLQAKVTALESQVGIAST
tara:strand:+ start:233 stop:1822 length:1590 start_codon:yes stop_codon:yes gene_type:complete